MLAALLANITYKSHSPQRGGGRPEGETTRDFSEQDPEQLKRLRETRRAPMRTVIEVIRSEAERSTEGQRSTEGRDRDSSQSGKTETENAGSIPATSTPDDDTVTIIHLPETSGGVNIAAAMEKAREAGLEAEMAQAILEDDDEAMALILIAAEL